jgi:hypothetical protein
MYGSADPNPFQNVTDLEHWFVPTRLALVWRYPVLRFSAETTRKHNSLKALRICWYRSINVPNFIIFL